MQTQIRSETFSCLASTSYRREVADMEFECLYEMPCLKIDYLDSKGPSWSLWLCAVILKEQEHLRHGWRTYMPSVAL